MEVNTRINHSIRSVLKNFGYEKLGVLLYNLKQHKTIQSIFKKVQSGIALTQNESKLDKITMVEYICSSGSLVKGLQGLKDVEEQADQLDHKECLEILYNYEVETIRKILSAYTELVINKRCMDMKKRRMEFEKIFEERLNLVPLLAYAKEKLKVEGQHPPEYHPLLLFFHKALTPPTDAGYRPMDIEFIFHFLLYEGQIFLQTLFTKKRDPEPLLNVTNSLFKYLGQPDIKNAMQKAGLKFNLVLKG